MIVELGVMNPENGFAIEKESFETSTHLHLLRKPSPEVNMTFLVDAYHHQKDVGRSQRDDRSQRSAFRILARLPSPLDWISTVLSNVAFSLRVRNFGLLPSFLVQMYEMCSKTTDLSSWYIVTH